MGTIRGINMDQIILEYTSQIVGNRKRKMALVECPDCSEQRTIRVDSLKVNETTCCRSCLNLRRPTKPEEELFNYTEYYRSKEGKLAHIYQGQKQRSKEKGWKQPDYTQKELLDWAMEQEIYHRLFTDWEDSSYQRDLAPSVDRIDDYKPYSLDNIQLMSWDSNNKKGTYYQKIGKNQKNSKAVQQYDLDGNFIQEFHSLKHAERQTGVNNATISSACRDPKYTAGGFRWYYSQEQ